MHPHDGARRRRVVHQRREPVVHSYVGVPPAVLEHRRGDHVVIERPQRGITEPLVEPLDLVGRQRHADQVHAGAVPRVRGGARRSGPAHPHTIRALHDRLQRADQAAWAALPSRRPIRHLLGNHWQPVGHHDEVVLSTYTVRVGTLGGHPTATTIAVGGEVEHVVSFSFLVGTGCRARRGSVEWVAASRSRSATSGRGWSGRCKAARRRADDPSDPSSGLLSLQPHQGEQRVRGGVTHPSQQRTWTAGAQQALIAPAAPRTRLASGRRVASIWPSGPDTAKQVGTEAPAMNRVDIQQELRQAQTDSHQLVAGATPQNLHRRSDGTRWTNRQLLWHMVFGYLIVRTLMPPVHLLGRLGLEPPMHRHPRCPASTVPPDQLRRVRRWRVATATPEDRRDHGRDDQRSRPSARRGNARVARAHDALPDSLGPYFWYTISLFDVYHYGTEHHNHHHRQLTLHVS